MNLNIYVYNQKILKEVKVLRFLCNHWVTSLVPRNPLTDIGSRPGTFCLVGMAQLTSSLRGLQFFWDARFLHPRRASKFEMIRIKMEYTPLKRTAKAPENRPRAPKGKDRLPTINFQGLYVAMLASKGWYIFPMGKNGREFSIAKSQSSGFRHVSPPFRL